MARASRHYIPGFIWHITHRCHKRDFLLRFRKDRHRWTQWLYEARKRYGITILKYTVTSNHIHLLVKDTGVQDSLSRTIQLTAGRTAQEYNNRKHRKGERGHWPREWNCASRCFPIMSFLSPKRRIWSPKSANFDRHFTLY